LVVTDANKALASSATVPADSVNKAAMSAVDYGDFTAGADGTCDIDADAVGAAELADDAVVKASLSAVDYGDFTAGSDGTCTVDNGAITTNKMATYISAVITSPFTSMTFVNGVLVTYQ
jgi:hypothetical protein